MAQFAVSRANHQLVERHRPGIEAEFRVAVQLSSYAEPHQAVNTARLTGGLDEPDTVIGHVGVGSLPRPRDRLPEQVWVEIEGDPAGTSQAKVRRQFQEEILY